MVGNGDVAETPEQLDTWIGQRPDVRESLRADGYGTDFSAEDLFPLLQVFVGRLGVRLRNRPRVLVLPTAGGCCRHSCW
jgi:hypothetical protein